MQKISYFLLLLWAISISTVFGQDKVEKSEMNYWKQFQNDLQFNFNGRLDYHYTGYEHEIGDQVMDQRFQFYDFRIGLSGLLTKNIGFNFLYTPSASDVGMNKISDNFLVANFTYTSNNKHWLLQAGKGFVNVGTVEQSYNPADVYVYSIIGNNLGIFKTGVTAQYTTTSQQHFGVQILNANEDSLGHQSHFEYNFYWYGHIVKDKISTFGSYTTIPFSNQFSTFPFSINLGIKWQLGNWALDTDYAIQKNMPNFHENALYQSIPIRLMYHGKKFRPFIKYIYNTVDFDSPYTLAEQGTSIDHAKIHTVELALQYYPYPNKNLRFHLVGSYSSDKNNIHGLPNNDPNSRQHYNTQFQIMAGVRIGFDFLKGW